VNIAIIEDHRLMRDVLRKACVEDFGYQVVAEEGDGFSAIRAVVRARPDLVLLDLQLPGLDGLAVVAGIRQTIRDCRFLVLSSYCDDFTVYRVERAQVQGFVDKNSTTVTCLHDAIAAVAAGGVYFSDTFRRLKLARRENPRAFDKVLTERETTVTALTGHLLADSEIAQQLGISPATVQKHRGNILHKLNLRSKAELERYARDHGFKTETLAQRLEP
jgi:DNA-binding NarL/FixJ family response regulator